MARLPFVGSLIPGAASRVRVSIGDWSAMTGGDPELDSDGNAWVLQELGGWFGGVAVRSESTPQPMADGEFDGPSLRGARTVTVSGTLLAESEAALFAGMDRAAGLLGGATRRAWFVVDEDVRGFSRGMLARLAGPTELSRVGKRAASFSMSLYSPDPCRYSDPLTGTTVLGGRQYVDARNAGDTLTRPVVTFTGPIINPVLTKANGDTLGLLLTIADGDIVEVDCRDRGVWLSTPPATVRASRRYLLAAGSSWLTVPPGVTRFTFTSDDVTPTGTCSMGWRSAWN